MFNSENRFVKVELLISMPQPPTPVLKVTAAELTIPNKPLPGASASTGGSTQCAAVRIDVPSLNSEPLQLPLGNSIHTSPFRATPSAVVVEVTMMLDDCGSPAPITTALDGAARPMRSTSVLMRMRYQTLLDSTLPGQGGQVD